MMEAYLDLVSQVPVVRVSFVPDRDDLAPLLDGIIDGLPLERPTEAQTAHSA
ncbi:MAG: hypothetical protein QM736_06750 [Vicinamibacterales bacterium]